MAEPTITFLQDINTTSNKTDEINRLIMYQRFIIEYDRKVSKDIKSTIYLLTVLLVLFLLFIYIISIQQRDIKELE